MGCGASISEIDGEKLKKVCKAMAKQMAEVSEAHVYAQAKEESFELTIEPPTTGFNSVRQASKSLTDAARAITDEIDEKKNSKEEEKEAGEQGDGDKKSGGGFMGKAAQLMGSVLETAKDMTLGGIADGLTRSAGALDSAMETIEKDLSKTGTELFREKTDEIHKILSGHIKNGAYDDAVQLVRIDPASNGEQNPGRIALYILDKSKDALAKEINDHEVVRTYLEKHATLKAWEKAIAAHNEASKLLGKAHDSGNIPEQVKKLLPKLEQVDLNLQLHIVHETVNAVMRLMMKREEYLRNYPINLEPPKDITHPEIFFKAFSNGKLTQSDYNKVCPEAV